MNAEQMELARRFAACPKWVWLPGMLAPGRGRVCGVDGGTLFFAGSDGRFNGDWEDHQCVPDLADALTRAGLLEVVRRAWGRNAWVREDESGWFQCDALFQSPSLGTVERLGLGPSELHALLAALEAAP